MGLEIEVATPYRIKDGQREPLIMSEDMWSCAEGDRITIETRTVALPVMLLAGRVMPHIRIALCDSTYEAKYELFIDTWAGKTSLRLEAGESSIILRFNAKPHNQKIGEDEFDAMLHELTLRSSGLIWGLSPGKQKGDIATLSPVVVHPSVISSQLPGLLRLLSMFAAEPPYTAQKSREILPFNRGKRVDLITLRWLGSRPKLLETARGRFESSDTTISQPLINQLTLRYSYDHPVMRYFSYLINRLISRFESSACILKAGPQRRFRDPEVEAHAAALATELNNAASTLGAILEKSPFKGLSPAPPTETVLQILVDHPLCCAINRTAQLLLTPGLAFGPSGDIESALKHTYDLFELFVLFRLLDHLQTELGAGWSLRSHKFYSHLGREDRPRDRAVWLFNGPGDMTLELRYQQSFSRMKGVTDERMFTSLSGESIPDYLLIVRKKRLVIAWIILDAKYRASRQAVDRGLADVHRYRDSLRIRGGRAEAAFVIVPRLREKNEVYATNAFHDQHNFGVIELFTEEWLRPALKSLKVI